MNIEIKDSYLELKLKQKAALENKSVEEYVEFILKEKMFDEDFNFSISGIGGAKPFNTQLFTEE